MFEGPNKTQAVENHRFDDKRGHPDKNGPNAELAPLGKNILVEPDFGKTETESGILLANSRKKDIPTTGWIIALGPDVEQLEVGDYIVFDSYQGKGFWNMQVANIPIEEKDVKAVIGDRKR